MFMDYQISSQSAHIRISTNKRSLIHPAYHITRGIYGECCSIVKADLHGTTLSHAINLRQVYDMNRFV